MMTKEWAKKFRTDDALLLRSGLSARTDWLKFVFNLSVRKDYLPDQGCDSSSLSNNLHLSLRHLYTGKPVVVSKKNECWLFSQASNHVNNDLAGDNWDMVFSHAQFAPAYLIQNRDQFNIYFTSVIYKWSYCFSDSKTMATLVNYSCKSCIKNWLHSFFASQVIYTQEILL